MWHIMLLQQDFRVKGDIKCTYEGRTIVFNAVNIWSQ